MMTDRGADKIILCHVSDEKYDVLIPQPPTDAICLSENKFITYFGQYLYLFELGVLERDFKIRKLQTTGLWGQAWIPESLGCDTIRYRSQSLEYEWRVYEPIDVEKYSIGIVEHWDHMKGVIGKYRVDEAVQNIAVDLMRYNGELR